MMNSIEVVKSKYELIEPFLDERTRRVWAATEAKGIGHGGITLVAEATGMSRNTIVAGRADLERATQEGKVREEIRKAGGGRKKLTEKDETLLSDLEKLVNPATRGEPDSPLLWTCKSAMSLADALEEQGHEISERSVLRLLDELGYSMQAPSKTREISYHADRNEQFEYINEEVREFQNQAQPVVSVDAKKKELVGDFDNGGQEWQLVGQPEKVRVHDFEDKELGKVTPYGIYDVSLNKGWVSVGVDHDTAEFAVESLRRWWNNMGKEAYPNARHLLVVADGGGSNSSRSRLWKQQLQLLANEIGIAIHVSHLPPGTSKWNKIEHRMFSFITQNWRGRPLISREVIVNLIANTTTQKGLNIQAQLDLNNYSKGIKISDEELSKLNIHFHQFHGEWNYVISPEIHIK